MREVGIMSAHKTELVYPTATRRIETGTARIKNSKRILEQNKNDFFDFLKRLEANGISQHQRISYISRLYPIMEIVGDKSFKSLTKRDMESIFSEYRKRHNYKQSSINKSIQCLKCFFRWVYDLSSHDPAPEVVRWLQKAEPKNQIRPEDLWTEEEVLAVMNASRSLRIKAMLSLAYESGMRPSELRTLRMRDISFNGDMIRVYCRGKTEKKMGERVIPVLRSYSLLKAYIEQHPLRNDPNAWFWSGTKKPVPELYLPRQFRILSQKVGIRKPNMLYILRHSRLTLWYRDLPSEVARSLSGHVSGSKMPETYTHLSEQDKENAIRGLYGYKKRQKEETNPLCRKCGEVLEFGAGICGHCGAPQNSQEAIKKMQDQDSMVEFAQFVIQRAKERGEIGELMTMKDSDYEKVRDMLKKMKN